MGSSVRHACFLVATVALLRWYILVALAGTVDLRNLTLFYNDHITGGYGSDALFYQKYWSISVSKPSGPPDCWGSIFGPLAAILKNWLPVALAPYGRQPAPQDPPPTANRIVVPLRNFRNCQYMLSCRMGAPSVESAGDISSKSKLGPFDLLADTGSFPTWVAGVGCKSCTAAQRYDSSLSATARKHSRVSRVRYGDATSVKGYEVMDSISLLSGIGESVLMRLARLPILEVFDYESVVTFEGDGILGLAGSPVSSPSASDLLDSFSAKVQSEKPCMPQSISFFLSYKEDESRFRSQMVIGEPDLTTFSKDTQFEYSSAPIQGNFRLWFTTLIGIRFEEGANLRRGNPLGPPDPSWHSLRILTLVDTGSTLSRIPAQIYWLLRGHLQRIGMCPNLESNKCKCPSRSIFRFSSSEPLLLLTFAAAPEKNPNSVVERRLTAKSVTTGTATRPSFTLSLNPNEYLLRIASNPSHCIFGFEPGMETAVLGMNFIRSYYTNFDMDANSTRVGFARSVASELPGLAQSRRVESEGVSWFVGVALQVFVIVVLCVVASLVRRFVSRYNQTSYPVILPAERSVLDEAADELFVRAGRDPYSGSSFPRDAAESPVEPPARSEVSVQLQEIPTSEQTGDSD